MWAHRDVGRSTQQKPEKKHSPLATSLRRNASKLKTEVRSARWIPNESLHHSGGVMPLARILANQEDDAASLCEQLHILGYVVEVVHPSTTSRDHADIEIVLDRMPAAQALAYAAQRSKDLQCDVWIAPDALPDLEPVPEAAEPQPFPPGWRAAATPITAQDSGEEPEAEPNFFPELEPIDLQSNIQPAIETKLPPSQEPGAGQRAPEHVLQNAVPELAPEESSSRRDALAIFVQNNAARISALFAASVGWLQSHSALQARQAVAAFEAAWNLFRSQVARLATQQRHWRASLSAFWQEKRQELSVRRAAAMRERESKELAAHAEMETLARQNALAWTSLAVASRSEAEEKSAHPAAALPLQQPSFPPAPALSSAGLQSPEKPGALQFPGTPSLPEPSVWLSPELKIASPPANFPESSSAPVNTRQVRDSASFWKWNGTTPQGTSSPSHRGPGPRAVQWRQAAAASALLALAMTVGFALGMRRNAPSLQSGNVASPAASAVAAAEAPAPQPKSSKASAQPAAIRTSAQEAIASDMPSPDLPDGDGVSGLAIITKPAETRRAATRVTRVSQNKGTHANVAVQHFGPEVVVRHFEQTPPAPKHQPDSTHGVTYYSDLN
jgi:hypothetical protein